MTDKEFLKTHEFRQAFEKTGMPDRLAMLTDDGARSYGSHWELYVVRKTYIHRECIEDNDAIKLFTDHFTGWFAKQEDDMILGCNSPDGWYLNWDHDNYPHDPRGEAVAPTRLQVLAKAIMENIS